MVENQESKGLAIASFVLALVGGILCLTVIGAALGIVCLVLALIFGIVALCKKQGAKRASIIGIIISVLGVAIFSVVTLFAGKFIANHKDQILSPITEFAAWVEENPEIAKLMENEEFKTQFEDMLEQRLEEKYGEDYENIEDLEGVFGVWEGLFEEMKSIAMELAEGNTIALENSEEEVVEEIVEEPVEEVIEEVSEEVVEEAAEEVVEEVVEETAE